MKQGLYMAMLTRRHKNEKGQALVEFTLMFPILLAVLIGLAGVSMLFYSYVTLQLAVREGTNAIVHDPVNETTASITTLVRTMTFSFDPNSVNVIVTDKANWISGAPVSVSASYSVPLPTVNMYLPGGASLRLGPIPISASSKMTIE